MRDKAERTVRLVRSVGNRKTSLLSRKRYHTYTFSPVAPKEIKNANPYSTVPYLSYQRVGHAYA